MKKIRLYLLYIFVLQVPAYFSQSAEKVTAVNSVQSPSPFAREGDIFGKRNFIENKGQFTLPSGEKVLFIYEYQGEKVIFTNNAVFYEVCRPAGITHEQMEAIEHGEAVKEEPPRFVKMTWCNSKAVSVTGEDMPGHYFTYGGPEYNSYAYRKIVYKDIYKNTDLVYTIPNDKEKGIKYSLILHPGADARNIKMFYEGDFRSMALNEGDLFIRTKKDPVIDHAPRSFYLNGDTVASAFQLLRNDTVSFKFPGGYDASKTLVIDPWVTTISNLVSTNSAFDVDYDFGGNTFVYGGSSTFQIAMYNSSGTHQWTFGGTIVSPSWGTAFSASNFGVDKFTGKSFAGQGVVGSGAQVIRLDINGNYDNFISTANSSYREIWDLGFHCTTADVFIFGGSTAGNLSAATINSVNATLNVTSFQSNTGCCQDVVNYAIDDVGNIFILYASGSSTLSNNLCLVNSAFNGNIWTKPTGYTSMGENNNKPAYQPPVSSNGFNCLAVNSNYLFYYDGYNLAAYNKTNGSSVASTVLSGQTLKRQGGIAVDDCNNLYLGSNGNILTYNFNGTSFSTLTPISLGITTSTQNVHDIKFERNTNVLYVCGTGFVGIYGASVSNTCPIPQGVCLFNQAGLGASTTSITCATLGSASVTLNGGIGPYTYTWVPSGTTGSVNSGLSPGTYTVVVNDAGNNKTYTTSITFVSPVPLSGTVMPVQLDCFGVNNATAAVQNLSGGSSLQKYIWKSSTTTQTSVVATGLAPGLHTVTVTDALTNCSFTQTFNVTSPTALTLNVHVNTPSVCAGKFITLTPLIAGGTVGGNGYTFSWTPFSSSGVFQTTQLLGGNYIYTVTGYDAKLCPITKTVPITFFPTPTLTVADASICPGQVAIFSVSGANTYSWNSVAGLSSLTVSPASTTIYTVIGTGSLCSSNKTITAVVMPVPVPTLTSNAPICNGKTLVLSAAGGTSALWNGPLSYTSGLLQPSITLASPNNSGAYQATITAANTCTASAAINVQVNATPAIAVAGSTVCVNSSLQLAGSGPPGCTYLWTGPNGYISVLQSPVITNAQVTASGVYSLTIKDNNTCNNSATVQAVVVAAPVVSFTDNAPLCTGKTLVLNASSTAGALQYIWTGPNAFSSAVQNPVLSNVSVSHGGVYSLMAVNGPCSVSLSKQITVNPLPVLNMPLQLEVCEGKTISLNPVISSGIVSTIWKGPDGFSSGAPSHQIFPAAPRHSGSYGLTITDVNGCQSYSAVAVTVKPNPVISAGNVTVCLGEPAALAAEGANAYLWQGPSLGSNYGPTVNVISASNSLLTTYTVTGTAANQCSTAITMSLYTIPLPVPKFFIYPREELCLNDKVTFEGEGGTQYEWRGPENLVYNGKKISFALIYQGYEGSYFLTVKDNNQCSATVERTIAINPLPEGKMKSSKMEGCVPFCSDFIFTPVSSSTTARWQIERISLAGNTFSYCFNRTGAISLSGFLLDAVTGCSNSVEYVVNVFPKPVADFTYAPQNPVENNDVVVFTANTDDPDINKFKWSFISSDGFTSTQRSTKLMFETEGMYPAVLEVENKWGCRDTVIKSIKVDPDFLVFVPNVFSPNTDGLNEQFIPVMRAVKQYQLSIYDRWGELLFSTTDFRKGWDGTYKDQDCKSDVYVWVINLSALNGQSKILKGHVTLYR